MDKKELKKLLMENKVPNDLYSIDGGLPNESYCLEEIDGKWHVYYSERGLKRSIQFLESEEEACYCLFNTINNVMQIK